MSEIKIGKYVEKLKKNPLKQGKKREEIRNGSDIRLALGTARALLSIVD